MESKDIGFIIKSISEIMDKKTNERLKALDITRSQARLLMYLFTHNGENVTQRQIETYLNISHTTTVGLINRLEGKGFISTHISSVDKRQKIITLCDTAYEQQKRMEKHMSRCGRDMIAGFSEDEKNELIRLLEKLYININKEVGK